MHEVKVEGLADLQKMLDELPAKIEANVVRGGLRAGAKVVMEEAQRLCPVATPNMENIRLYGGHAGALRNSIRISGKRVKGKVIFRVVAGNATAYYARMVEFGTARHWIKPANRKSLFLAGLFKEAIDHPGAQKKPFMRPAIDNKANEAIDAMADYIRERIPKELSKQK